MEDIEVRVSVEGNTVLLADSLALFCLFKYGGYPRNDQQWSEVVAHNGVQVEIRHIETSKRKRFENLRKLRRRIPGSQSKTDAMHSGLREG